MRHQRIVKTGGETSTMSRDENRAYCPLNAQGRNYITPSGLQRPKDEHRFWSPGNVPVTEMVVN